MMLKKSKKKKKEDECDIDIIIEVRRIVFLLNTEEIWCYVINIIIS